MNIRISILLFSLTIASIPFSAYACSGGACDDIELSWNNQCLTLINNGGDKVKVVWKDTIAKYTVELKPGESKSPKNVVGTCTSAVVNLTASRL